MFHNFDTTDFSVFEKKRYDEKPVKGGFSKKTQQKHPPTNQQEFLKGGGDGTFKNKKFEGVSDTTKTDVKFANASGKNLKFSQNKKLQPASKLPTDRFSKDFSKTKRFQGSSIGKTQFPQSQVVETQSSVAPHKKRRRRGGKRWRQYLLRKQNKELQQSQVDQQIEPQNAHQKKHQGFKKNEYSQQYGSQQKNLKGKVFASSKSDFSQKLVGTADRKNSSGNFVRYNLGSKFKNTKRLKTQVQKRRYVPGSMDDSQYRWNMAPPSWQREDLLQFWQNRYTSSVRFLTDQMEQKPFFPNLKRRAVHWRPGYTWSARKVYHMRRKGKLSSLIYQFRKSPLQQSNFKTKLRSIAVWKDWTKKFLIQKYVLNRGFFNNYKRLRLLRSIVKFKKFHTQNKLCRFFDFFESKFRIILLRICGLGLLNVDSARKSIIRGEFLVNGVIEKSPEKNIKNGSIVRQQKIYANSPLIKNLEVFPRTFAIVNLQKLYTVGQIYNNLFGSVKFLHRHIVLSGERKFPESWEQEKGDPARRALMLLEKRTNISRWNVMVFSKLHRLKHLLSRVRIASLKKKKKKQWIFHNLRLPKTYNRGVARKFLLQKLQQANQTSFKHTQTIINAFKKLSRLSRIPRKYFKKTLRKKKMLSSGHSIGSDQHLQHTSLLAHQVVGFSKVTKSLVFYLIRKSIPYTSESRGALWKNPSSLLKFPLKNQGIRIKSTPESRLDRVKLIAIARKSKLRVPFINSQNLRRKKKHRFLFFKFKKLNNQEWRKSSNLLYFNRPTLNEIGFERSFWHLRSNNLQFLSENKLSIWNHFSCNLVSRLANSIKRFRFPESEVAVSRSKLLRRLTQLHYWSCTGMDRNFIIYGSGKMNWAAKETKKHLWELENVKTFRTGSFLFYKWLGLFFFIKPLKPYFLFTKGAFVYRALQYAIFRSIVRNS